MEQEHKHQCTQGLFVCLVRKALYILYQDNTQQRDRNLFWDVHMFACSVELGEWCKDLVEIPVLAVAEPAPSAAAVSPATGRPCFSAQSGLPGAAPSDHSAGWSSSTAGVPSLPEIRGYLVGGFVFLCRIRPFFFYSFLFRFCFSNVSNYHHYYTGGIKRYYSLLVLTVLLYNLSCFPIFPTKFLKTWSFSSLYKRKIIFLWWIIFFSFTKRYFCFY